MSICTTSIIKIRQNCKLSLDLELLLRKRSLGVKWKLQFSTIKCPALKGTVWSKQNQRLMPLSDQVNQTDINLIQLSVNAQSYQLEIVHLWRVRLTEPCVSNQIIQGGFTTVVLISKVQWRMRTPQTQSPDPSWKNDLASTCVHEFLVQHNLFDLHLFQHQQ